VAVIGNNYDHRGNANYGIVLCCPTLVASRLVYFDHNRSTGSWMIRDFIFGRWLSDDTSPLTVAQIEADARVDEFPPRRNVEKQPTDWAV
jgi:hypothetical protein